jgi:hypothetical protein
MRKKDKSISLEENRDCPFTLGWARFFRKDTEHKNQKRKAFILDFVKI